MIVGLIMAVVVGVVIGAVSGFALLTAILCCKRSLQPYGVHSLVSQNNENDYSRHSYTASQARCNVCLWHLSSVVSTRSKFWLLRNSRKKSAICLRCLPGQHGVSIKGSDICNIIIVIIITIITLGKTTTTLPLNCQVAFKFPLCIIQWLLASQYLSYRMNLVNTDVMFHTQKLSEYLAQNWNLCNFGLFLD